MRRYLLSGIPLAFVLAACAGSSPSTSPLVGTWVPQGAEFAGGVFEIANFRGAVLQLTADTYAFGNDRGTYALRAIESPAAMDIRGLEGPNAGRTILAIQRRDGDALTICYQLGAEGRPPAFATTKGSQLLLVFYRRIAA